MRARSRAGDEQKDSLHGLQEGAAVQDGEFSARPVKSITANSKLSDNLASVLGESECPPQRFYNTLILVYNLPFSGYDSDESAEL